MRIVIKTLAVLSNNKWSKIRIASWNKASYNDWWSVAYIIYSTMERGAEMFENDLLNISLFYLISDSYFLH